MSPFTKFLDNLKSQQKTNFTNSALKPTASGTVDDSAIVGMKEHQQNQQPRRWSYVTYLNEGTLHGDDDNLIVGL